MTAARVIEKERARERERGGEVVNAIMCIACTHAGALFSMLCACLRVCVCALVCTKFMIRDNRIYEDQRTQFSMHNLTTSSGCPPRHRPATQQPTTHPTSLPPACDETDRTCVCVCIMRMNRVRVRYASHRFAPAGTAGDTNFDQHFPSFVGTFFFCVCHSL